MLPTGCVYQDRASKGRKARSRIRWCAELIFLGKRIRKRSYNELVVRQWLALVHAVMNEEFSEDYATAPKEELLDRFMQLKPRLLKEEIRPIEPLKYI